MSKKIDPREAREAAGITPQELAYRCPCAQATVYNVEKSGKWPKHRLIRSAYLRALGLQEVKGQIVAAKP